MVGILSPEMLEIAWVKAGSLEESSSWLSLMIIFKETILESAAALLVAVWLVIGGSGVAATWAQEVADAGKAGLDEAGVAVSIKEVEGDVDKPGVAVNGAAVKADVEEADSDVAERVNTG